MRLKFLGRAPTDTDDVEGGRSNMGRASTCLHISNFLDDYDTTRFASGIASNETDNAYLECGGFRRGAGDALLLHSCRWPFLLRVLSNRQTVGLKTAAKLVHRHLSKTNRRSINLK